MSRIPEHFIQELLSRLDIVSLIQTYFPLKKMGANYSACCPFHQEKTPSFSVNQAKQFYHCFGCGEHGDAISFVSKMEHLNFIETLEKLSRQVGLVMPQDRSQGDSDYASLYAVLEKAKTFYFRQLKVHPAAKAAVTYLKSRGLTGQTAKTFSIGFAPPGWSSLLDHCPQSDQREMEIAGLLIPGKNGRPYDRFRNRIVFPILDLKGRTIGFGARTLGNEQPKYLNSPETPLFHKGKQFYGLSEALKTRDHERLIVVEGYLDVIMLSQSGIPGVVATLGTALTESHAKILFKYTTEIVFCFDGDAAGRNAAEKAFAIVLPEMQTGREVKFVFLPQNHDPDSFVRENGAVAFQALLENALPLSEYFFQTALKNVSIASLTQKAAIIEKAQIALEQLPHGIYRALMEERLRDMMPKQFHWKKKDVPPESMPPAIKAGLMLILQPKLVDHLKDKRTLFEQPVEGLAFLKFIVQQCQVEQLTSENLTSICVQHGLPLARYAPYFQSLETLPQMGLEQEFKGAIERVLEIGRKYLTEKLLEKSKNGELSDSEKQTLKDLLT
ncbi:MAG: DNA primase [Gammaproteobacteria bacterium]